MGRHSHSLDDEVARLQKLSNYFIYNDLRWFQIGRRLSRFMQKSSGTDPEDLFWEALCAWQYMHLGLIKVRNKAEVLVSGTDPWRTLMGQKLHIYAESMEKYSDGNRLPDWYTLYSRAVFLEQSDSAKRVFQKLVEAIHRDFKTPVHV